ncbi:MAG: hypothetical protein WCT05_01895, partial [Lentisphaeria bacterium]
KKFRVQFLVMQKSSKSLKIRIMKSIFSNFHPQIMVKKQIFFNVIQSLVLHSERNFNRWMTFHVASAKNTAFAKSSTILFEGLQNNP